MFQDTWAANILCSETARWSLNFEQDEVKQLHLIKVPFELKVTQNCLMHGIASWFDVNFIGSQ